MNAKFPVSDLFKSRWDTFCYVVLSIALLSFAVTYLVRPIADPDFWWHLKSGELIARARAIFSADPFNFTGDPALLTMRERTTLNGYWLWQVIAFGFYSLGGFPGIKLMNALTLVGIYSVLVWFLIGNKVRLPIVYFLLVISLVVFQDLFYLERPQVLSFLLATVLVGLFVKIRRGERPGWGLFPVMIVWGNLHGGFIIGVMLLGLFCLGSLWDFRGDRERLRSVVLWCLGGILVAHLNPNGFNTYLGVWESLGAGVTTGISEYQSTLAAVADSRLILLLWGLMAVHFWALQEMPGKRFCADWLVSLLLAVLAFFYLRHVAFFAVSLLPMTGVLLENACASENSMIRRSGRRVCLAGSCAFLVYVGFALQQTYEARKSGDLGDVNRIYPQGLANFLLSVPLHGNIYNEYNWGGYLVWKLYPNYKLFIDGRGLYPQVTADYNKISSASLEIINGRYEYEALLDKYNIRIIAASNEINFKNLNILLKFILNKPDWYPVYIDDVSYVLIKKSVDNYDVINKYGINKIVFLNKLLSLYNNSLAKNPQDVARHIGRGELLGYMGHYAEAERDFAVVKQLDPDNPILPAKLKQLAELREKAQAGQNSSGR